MFASRRMVLQALGVVLTGAALGAVINGVSRHPASLLEPVFPTSASGPSVCSGPPSPEVVARVGAMSQAEAVSACAACSAAFVDARGAVAFAHGHLPGALHLPPVGHHDETTAVEPLRGYGLVVVYDEGGSGCALARGVAERLVAMGLPDVRVLEGGWAKWQEAGSAAESGACTECGGPGQASGAAEGGR